MTHTCRVRNACAVWRVRYVRCSMCCSVCCSVCCSACCSVCCSACCMLQHTCRVRSACALWRVRSVSVCCSPDTVSTTSSSRLNWSTSREHNLVVISLAGDEAPRDPPPVAGTYTHYLKSQLDVQVYSHLSSDITSRRRGTERPFSSSWYSFSRALQNRAKITGLFCRI